jgi:hypothetical protein
MGISVRDVTVVVPTRSRKDRVGTLLSNLTHPHDRVIVVVDKGRESEDLPANLNGQTVIACEPDCGSVRAQETGILSAETSHVLCLNDDVELFPGCIEEAVQFYNETFPKGDGVVGLNHGEEFKHIGCFTIMPKSFYVENCFPTPFKRYCVDNEITEKAAALGLYARCESARLKHDFPPHVEPDHTEDWKAFHPRMLRWAKSLGLDKAVVSGQPKVFIAVPILFWVDPHFFDCVTNFLCHKWPFAYQFARLVGDSDISRARNTLTAGFLVSECTHLLFIDSDLAFSGEHIARILSHDEDVVGGFYPKKKQSEVSEWVCNAQIPPQPVDERGLIPVRYMGTGFLMVKRRVIEKMLEVHGDELVFEVDDVPGKFGFDLWRRGVYKYKDGHRRYLTEDWLFCQTALDLGFNVYGDHKVILKHSGNAVYPLNSQEKKMREMGLFGTATPPVEVPTAAGSTPSPARELAATFA